MRKLSIMAVQVEPTESLIHDMSKEGWILRGGAFGKVSQTGEIKLELVKILRDGEDNISGEEMDNRATNETSLSQHYAEVLERNIEAIPRDWDGLQILFPGTVWESPEYDGKRLKIPCFDQSNGAWALRFHWLGFIVDGPYRFIRIC